MTWGAVHWFAVLGANLYIYIYIYICIHTHTHTHTHKHTHILFIGIRALHFNDYRALHFIDYRHLRIPRPLTKLQMMSIANDVGSGR